MNYTEAEKFILSLQNKKRKEYMKDIKHCEIYLKRMQCFLDLIGNPEKQIPHYIHITGTSGKGSVALMISSILKTADKKVGTLTSPSPDTLQSRIEINNIKISKIEFAKIIEDNIKPAITKYEKVFPHNLPSFYEIITAIALKHFANKKINFAILEAGCGGRYDSTNIIPHKDIAIITNIGLDHTEILGNTKIKIAHEKVGIVKRGNTLFTTEPDKKILNVMEKYCDKTKAKLKILNTEQLTPNKNNKTNTLNKFNYKNKEYTLPVLGNHQIKNAILAIESTKFLKIPQKNIVEGLKEIKLPMRFETISKKPTIILDSAHNPDKIKSTVEAYNTIPKQKSLHLIISFTKKKDIKKMIEILNTTKPQTIAITKYKKNNLRKPETPRLIAKIFKKALKNTNIKTFNNVTKALSWSKAQASEKDLILITGSTYLAGEIKNSLNT